MFQPLLRVFALLLCMTAGAQLASAQTLATISGTVKDTSDAVLPGVTVTIKNVETGIARTLVTDDSGRYNAPNLSLGAYEVQAELAGFQTGVRSGITLTMGREAEVNFALQVGEVSEKVTVTGEAPLVETNRAELTDLVDTQKIQDLPLNGRSYTQLALMQPGVTSQSPTGSTYSGVSGGGVRLSINGSRSLNTAFYLDGTDIQGPMGRTPGSAAGQTLGVDTIREFTVLSSAYSAEFGGSGGVINSVTKSGTNDIHGSLFEFHRDSALDARNFRDVGALPPFKRDQFGGTVGGPIKRDRTFFLGSYEGFRQRLDSTATANVPTAAVKQGIVPTSIATSGQVTIHPAIRKYLDAMPLPNGALFNDGRGEYNFIQSTPIDETYLLGKIDHQIGPADSFYGRYTFDQSTTDNPLAFPNFALHIQTRYQYLTLEENKIISPTLLNTVRFAFNRSKAFLENTCEGYDVSLNVIPGADKCAPQMVVPSLASFGNNAIDDRFNVLNTFQISEKLTVTKGAHSMRMGTDMFRFHQNGYSASRLSGRIRFNSYFDFLTGRVLTWEYLVPGTGVMAGWRQNQFGFFIQDDIKVRSNFSMNMGVRWEFSTSPTEVAGRVSNLRNITDRTATIGDPFFNVPKKNFGPRFGFAWDPFSNGKTAVRAGFGLYHQQFASGTWIQAANQMVPFMIRTQIAATAFPPRFDATPAELPPSNPTTVEFNPKTPYMMQWNLTLQHQLGNDMVFAVSYVGSRGVHLGSNSNYNIARFEICPACSSPLANSVLPGSKYFPVGATNINPSFGSVESRVFNMDSYYHSFQLRASKRFNSGLQFQTSYTFARNLDNGSESQGGGSGPMDPYDTGREKGLAASDVRHNFSLNYTYDLPSLSQRARAMSLILGGWKLNGIASMSTGNPSYAAVGFNRSRSLNITSGGGNPEIPNLKPGANNNPVVGDGRNPDRYLDGSPFALADAGFLGNVGRNTIIGPGIISFDLSFVKNFHVAETRHFEVRSEFFNMFNRSNYANPNVTIFTSAAGTPSPTFGRINGTRTTPRQVQLALKFIF